MRENRKITKKQIQQMQENSISNDADRDIAQQDSPECGNPAGGALPEHASGAEQAAEARGDISESEQQGRRRNMPKPEFRQTEDRNILTVEGVFVPTINNNGVLLNTARCGKIRPTDPFVPKELVRRFGIKRGQYIIAKAHQGPGHQNPKVRFIETIDGLPCMERKHRLSFQNLTTIAPDEKLRLETKDERMTNRVMDIFCPVGKGTRGLIVAPPRTGKTTLLKDIAVGVFENNPECRVIILLVDERPEEVTDFKMDLPKAEIYASSNDENLDTHIRVSDIAIDRAKHLVEAGEDVVLLMDSLTRLSRAHNSLKARGGRTMTGGLDIRALERPRQIFSSARNTEEAGSLTIIASVLIETGSKMDELIFQEFKGTGNMEMVLDRKVAEMRIWPAINLAASGPRREELLLSPKYLEASAFLRRAMAGSRTEDAAETLMERMSQTRTNDEFVSLIL